MSAEPAALPTLVTLDRVEKRFANGTLALNDLNLAIGRGEFLSLLGPSGCGKSTALRLIAGLADPTAGAIRWAEGRPHGRDIGFVFQEPTLMPWATVTDNVFLPLRLAGESRSRAAPAIAAVLERVGLSGFKDAYPRELSGGMKMRVSIARALVTRPKILLMDEPFAALDEITRFKLNDDLLDVWREVGCTVVFVTHSVFESVYLSSRIVVMAARPGRITQALTIDQTQHRDGSFRTSADYAALCRHTSDALAAAMKDAA